MIFNPCGDFRWSPEGPVSQIHSPHLHDGAPGIFSDLLRTVQMLKREWGTESNGKLPHLFIPSKTAWVWGRRPDFGQNCSLGAWVCSEIPTLGQNILMMIMMISLYISSNYSCYIFVHYMFRQNIAIFRWFFMPVSWIVMNPPQWRMLKKLGVAS